MTRLNIAMLATENNEVQQEPVQLAQDHLEVLGQQVEDDLLQAQQAQIQSDKQDAAVEDALQATEDLYEEQQAAQELSENEQGQTKVAVESIQRNAKNILKSIGMEANALTTHNYVDAQSKGAGEDAKLTASTIGDFIKKIWEAIKAAWFKIVDAIKAFFKNIFNASVGLKKRALAVKDAAKSLKGKTIPSDASFDAPESVKVNMRMDHKALPASTFDKGLAKQNSVMNDFIEKLTSDYALSRYESGISEVIPKIVEGVAKRGQLDLGQGKEREKAIGEAISRTLEPVLVFFPQKKGDEMGTPAFISDRVITVNTDTLKAGVEVIDGGKELIGQHDPLELHQIETVTDIVAKQMDEYKGLDKEAENFKKFSKEIEKVQSDLVNQKKEIPFVERKLQSTVAASATRFFMNVIKTVATQGRLIDLQVNKAAIDWCAASLKLYK